MGVREDGGAGCFLYTILIACRDDAPFPKKH